MVANAPTPVDRVGTIVVIAAGGQQATIAATADEQGTNRRAVFELLIDAGNRVVVPRGDTRNCLGGHI